MLQQVGNTRPTGYNRPTGSYGPALPRQSQVGLKIQSICSRLIFKLIFYGYQYPKASGIKKIKKKNKLPRPSKTALLRLRAEAWEPDNLGYNSGSNTSLTHRASAA